MTSEMWICPTQKQGGDGPFRGGVAVSFIRPITLYISPQQSETTESSFCHTFIQGIFIEHLLHARCSSEHGRHSL